MAPQIKFFYLPRMLRVHSEVGSAWKSSLFGWLLILFFSIWYAWWCYHIPSPAKAATVLAVIAAIMAYRVEPKGFEKVGWTAVLFAFLFVEIHAIDRKDNQDEYERQHQRAEEARNFNEIGEGIKSAVNQSQTQFENTTAQLRKQFSATMARAQSGINAVTGGNSYVIAFPNTDGGPDQKTLPLTLILCETCIDSIPNATVRISALTPEIEDVLVYKGQLDPGVSLKPGFSLPVNSQSETRFVIRVLARNKATYEKLKVRFNQQVQRWEFACHIEREEVTPHLNPKTQMAEGMVMKVLRDVGWGSFGSTPINDATTKVLSQTKSK